MFLKTFLRSLIVLGVCFSANAMNFLEFDIISPTGSPTKSLRKSANKQLEKPTTRVDYTMVEQGESYDPKVILYIGNSGYVESVSPSQPSMESNEITRSLKTDKIFYNSHAFANTFFLSGAFYYSPDVSAVSAFYIVCCAIVYGVFCVNTNIKCAESQNLTEQNILNRLFYFQRRQSCLNMLAGASFMGGYFLEVPVVGYTLGGLALVAAVGNSVFFGCTN